MGRLLMVKMIDYLRKRGTAVVAGQCLYENGGMKTLARHLGFAVTGGPSPDVKTMTLALTGAAQPGPFKDAI